MEPITIKAPAPFLKAFASHCANENSRYAINGALVRVKSGMLTIAATDGHRLATYQTVSECPDGEVIVPVHVLKQIKPHKSSALQDAAITMRGVDDDGVRACSLEHGGIAISFTSEPVNFPPIREIVPHANENMMPGSPIIGFNAKYLAEAAKLISDCLKLTREDHFVVTIETNGGPNKPAAIRHNVFDICVTLMPYQTKEYKTAETLHEKNMNQVSDARSFEASQKKIA